MMKHIKITVIGLFALFFFTLVSAEEQHNCHLKYCGLKGKVRSYTLTVYTPKVKEGKIEKGQVSAVPVLQVKFNKNGQLIERNFSADNKLASQEIYHYDEQGNKIEYKYYYNNKLSSKVVIGMVITTK